MRTILMILLPCLVAGCTPASGNFTQVKDSQSQLMADDSAQTIAKLYPPATTRIYLSQVTNDAYGAALEKRLRANGYAVQKNEGLDDWWALVNPSSSTPSSPITMDRVSPDATVQAAPVMPVTTGSQPVGEVANVPVSYTLDALDSKMVRLSLTLETKQLSRVYAQSSKKFGPAGAWAMKE